MPELAEERSGTPNKRPNPGRAVSRESKKNAFFSTSKFSGIRRASPANLRSWAPGDLLRKREHNAARMPLDFS